MMQTPINSQILQSVELKWVKDAHPELILLLIFILLSCVLVITTLPLYTYYIYIRFKYQYMLYIWLFIALYSYILNKFHDFEGKHNSVMFNQAQNQLIDKLSDLINGKPRVLEHDKKMKNLILFQIETFEYAAITPTSMPFFTNLSKKYLYIDNIDSSIYTTWSSGGNLVTQCGIPHIITSLKWNSRRQDSMKYYLKVNCMTDYLRTVGYASHSFAMKYDAIMDYNKWRDSKFNRTFDSNNDRELFDHMSTKGIDFLLNLSKHQNYVAMVYNQDTHRPQRPKSYCKPENLNESLPRQAYNCLDQEMRKFINRFLELEMYKDTVMVMYGDHTMFGTPFSTYRKLVMLFPGYEKRKFTSPLTYYDFAPTIYEMIGIRKIYPDLPFGRSMFSNKPPKNPTYQDLNVMFHFLYSELNIKARRTDFECHGYTGGLCNDTNLI